MNIVLIAVGVGCIWGLPAAGVTCLVCAAIDILGQIALATMSK